MDDRTVQWDLTLDRIDWHELSELYRLAPLGIKPPEHLKKVYGHSLYRCFARDGGKLVGAGRARRRRGRPAAGTQGRRR